MPTQSIAARPVRSDYQTIVVHLDAIQHCRARLAVAGAIASSDAGHVIGVYLSDYLDLRLSCGDERSGASESGTVPDERQLGAALADFVKSYIATDSDNALELHIESGTMVDALLPWALSGDLLIMGEAPSSHRDDIHYITFPADMAVAAGKPVLVLPRPCPSGLLHLPERILIAWKPSRAAVRAVTDALPLLRQAKKVVLLSVGKRSARRAPDADQPPDMIAFLARHGVKASAYRTRVKESVTETLRQAARDLEADLIVAGAYSGSRLREWMLGGVTRELLTEMEFPVLLSH